MPGCGSRSEKGRWREGRGGPVRASRRRAADPGGNARGASGARGMEAVAHRAPAGCGRRQRHLQGDRAREGGSGLSGASGPDGAAPGWPKEMLRYPIRGFGVVRFGILLAIFAAVDSLSGWNAFVGWAVKLIALLYLVRWQIRAVSSTASGRDEIPPLGLDGTWEEFAWPALGFLGVAGLLTAPALFTWFILPLITKDPPGSLSVDPHRDPRPLSSHRDARAGVG